MTTLFPRIDELVSEKIYFPEHLSPYQLQAFIAEKIGFMAIDMLEPRAPIKMVRIDGTSGRIRWSRVFKMKRASYQQSRFKDSRILGDFDGWFANTMLIGTSSRRFEVGRWRRLAAEIGRTFKAHRPSNLIGASSFCTKDGKSERILFVISHR